MHAGKIVLLSLFILSYSVKSYSQKPDRKETISYINQKLGPVCEVAMKGGTLIVNYFDPKGKKVREDKAPAFALDTIINFEADEKVLSVNCTSDNKNCVTRTLYIHKTKKTYSRVTFVADVDEASLEGLKKAIVHLIKIDSQYRYNDEISFE